MIKIKSHKRISKNSVSVVSKHFRGRYGKKPKNDKYPARDNSKMDMGTLVKNRDKYQKEFDTYIKGSSVPTLRHKSFILRRLNNVRLAIKRKLKNN